MKATKVTELPVVHIESFQGQHYVAVNGLPWARFDVYEHAAQCCATIVNQEIRGLEATSVCKRQPKQWQQEIGALSEAQCEKLMQQAVRSEVRRCHAKRDLYDQQNTVNHYLQLVGAHPDSDEYFDAVLELERSVREELGYGDY